MKRIHEQNINTTAHYDRMWSLPDYKEEKFDPSRLRQLLRRVKNGDKVLELGAGVFGSVQYAFEKTKLAANFTAVDFCCTAIDMVAARIMLYPSCTKATFNYILGDVLRTGFDTSTFDVVIAGELIEHMEDPQQLAAEMARLTKPGGWMTISTVDPNCENAKKLEYPEHLWAFTPSDLLALFAPYGETEYRLFGDYHMVETQRY